MKILFEEYPYEKELVARYLPSYYLAPPRDGKVKIPYVGYFFNTDPEVMDSVFILPKVFINVKGKAFGEFEPEKIIDLNEKKSDFKESNYYSEIFNLSVWIYRSIVRYIDLHKDENISHVDKLLDVVSVNGDSSGSFLDVILKLIRFNNEHRNLFTYITKINSRGNNRVHWGKTISRIQPIMQADVPIYPKYMNKAKALNVDEELIVLFYSVLDYLHDKYNFKVLHNLNYETDIRYVERLIKSARGTRVMRAMRKKYFTDELVELWKILNLFFQKAESVSANKYTDETLLIKNYNLVFEDMIDQLISDETRDIYPDLKEQDDGKIVDHIYRYSSLIGDDFLYYIGDSKYYKEGNEPNRNSIYKQFTYAKNVIQYNIDIFNNAHGRTKKDIRKGDVRYRDELTEGYNITPNFFIRGKVNHNNLNYAEDELQKEEEKPIISYQFENRLFDRDTLFLQKYSINFLFVLASYASKHNDNGYRDYIRSAFKKNVISDVDHEFRFIILQSKSFDLRGAINRNFRLLNGRIYKAFNVERIVIFAYERKKKGLNDVLLELDKDFNLYDFTFSEENNTLVKLHEAMQRGKIDVSKLKKVSKPTKVIQTEFQFMNEGNSTGNNAMVFSEMQEGCIPLYTVEAACGRFAYNGFSDTEEPEIEGWVNALGHGFTPDKDKYFAVYAKGNSMSPKINDGDICVFEWYKEIGGTREGEIVLVYSENPFTDGSTYTIKKYHHQKGKVEQIILEPINKEYNPIILEEDQKAYTIGIFKCVL